MTFQKARDMIEIRKLVQEPDYYKDMIDLSLEVLRQKYLDAVRPADMIFYGYLYQEKKCFGLDYNDLIKFTLHIFSQRPDLREKWQQRLEYIMIDEFQDIDWLQYQLMEALCGYHKNLFVVGDPDQTIYSWRGADIKYLLDLDKAYPGTRTILMMKNYRSTPQILAAANSLIDKNQYRIKKDLIPTLAPGLLSVAIWPIPRKRRPNGWWNNSAPFMREASPGRTWLSSTGPLRLPGGGRGFSWRPNPLCHL